MRYSARALANHTARLALVGLAALAVGCNLPPSFGPEYRDSTTNFIASSLLMAPTVGADSMNGTDLDPSAVWDWSWRGRTGNTFEYMILSDNGSSTAPGGIGDEWLLSAENLAVNPVFSSASTGWSDFGGAASSLVTPPPDAINGKSLKITVDDPGTDYVEVTDSLFDDSDTAGIKNYLISFNAHSSENIRFKAFPGSYNAENLQNPLWSGDGRYLLPASESEGFSNTSSTYLAFSGLSGTGYSLDDIHAIRSDVDVRRWSLSIRLRAADTSPSLVPGTYEFSVWVKEPAGYYTADDPARGDDPKYAAMNLTLRMFNIATNTSIAEESFSIKTYSSWTRIVLRMPSGNTLDFSETDPSQILELSISPMDPERPEAGAVLIAEPQLRYYIDGY